MDGTNQLLRKVWGENQITCFKAAKLSIHHVSYVHKKNSSDYSDSELGGGRDDSSFSIIHMKSYWVGSHWGFSDGKNVGHKVCVPLLIYDCTSACSSSPSVLLTSGANTHTFTDTQAQGYFS